MTAALVAVAFAVGLGFGFLLGLWAYVRVHEMFFAKAQEAAARKVTMALQQERNKLLEKRQTVDRLRQMYGEDFSAKHAGVIDEEVERILSAGPTNGRTP